MNKLNKAFENKKAFIPFITAGDPDLETSEQLVIEMAAAGADLIELGIPFSDPVAEGIVIQKADLRSLAAGTTTDKIFEAVRRIRQKTDVPLAFMTYINPIFVYGIDRFLANCHDFCIDAVIVPDLPFEEKGELYPACEKHGVYLISLIAPTSKERTSMIASQAQGFAYCVSSLGVTGIRGEITTDIAAMVRSIKASKDIPCAVGFGISTPEQAREIAKISDGVIVGSAIVKIAEQYNKNCIAPICDYVRRMKSAISEL